MTNPTDFAAIKARDEREGVEPLIGHHYGYEVWINQLLADRHTLVGMVEEEKRAYEAACQQTYRLVKDASKREEVLERRTALLREAMEYVEGSIEDLENPRRLDAQELAPRIRAELGEEPSAPLVQGEKKI